METVQEQSLKQTVNKKKNLTEMFQGWIAIWLKKKKKKALNEVDSLWKWNTKLYWTLLEHKPIM